VNPFWRSKRRAAVVAAAAASAIILSACSGSSGGANTNSTNPYSGHLTYWFWAESDVPGSTKWMQATIGRYEKLHPGIHIDLVPQATETLQGAFQTAAQAKTGPDIAMQWATLPVLTPVWRGQVAPLTGLVPDAEINQWRNTQENTYQGKVWAMPLYLLGVPFVWNKDLFKKAGLDATRAPRTWDELLADCAKLKAAGITPIMVGDKDGAFGSWFQSVVGTQTLDSVKQLQAPYAGKANFADPKYSGYLTRLEELKKDGYINSDVASIEATEAWQGFAQGKGAMTWTTDGNVAAWAKQGLGAKLGVAKTPQAGTGKLAEDYDATQSISAFITSWSSEKPQAAAFLTWLHNAKNTTSWYTSTGAFPADKRFDSSAIKNPLMAQLYKLDSMPNQLWAENYAPPQVDDQGLRTVAQALLAGSISASQATSQITSIIKSWQTQQPADFKTYQNWAAG
jgi:ABC-type glycerol-3-phosphate transport system substrate-binding protein